MKVLSDVLDYNWRNEAACRNSDPDLFFPKETPHSKRRSYVRVTVENERKAKEICGSCSVLEECLTEAMVIGPKLGWYGILAGLTAKERKQLHDERA